MAISKQNDARQLTLSGNGIFERSSSHLKGATLPQWTIIKARSRKDYLVQGKPCHGPMMNVHPRELWTEINHLGSWQVARAYRLIVVGRFILLHSVGPASLAGSSLIMRPNSLDVLHCAFESGAILAPIVVKGSLEEDSPA
jgi:hypothetical protein